SESGLSSLIFGSTDGAANVAASLLKRFPQLVEQHLAGRCETCRDGTFSAQRPYEVEASRS
ncbi:MAG TPA: hypothetical protein PLI79_20315, partial [Mycobacterium sp.]|nr:hypothetical protein [Mycobacterium sp.]